MNWDKESTKVRVCLDAKAKYKGVSLNDALLKGKMEMIDIFQALTRFRAGKNALLGDIRKMFWQIKLSRDDEKYHGVVWQRDTLVNTCVCFGDTNSSPIADRSMLKIAVAGKERYPYAYESIVDKQYMDDIMDAKSSEKNLVRTRDETEALLGKFGFEIKKWFSNNPKIGIVCKNNEVMGLKWDAQNGIMSVNIKYGNRWASRDFHKETGPLQNRSNLGPNRNLHCIYDKS